MRRSLHKIVCRWESRVITAELYTMRVWGILTVLLYIYIADVAAGGCKPPRADHSTQVFNVTKYPTPQGLFPFDTVIAYTCKPGFTHRHGSSTRRCSGRRWTGFVLVCKKKRIKCPNLESLPGGKIIGKRYEEGVEVSFVCFPGLQLVGNSKIVCKKNGNWSSPVPVCLRQKYCQDPGDQPNAVRTDDKKFPGVEIFGIGDRVRYECNTGFLIGEFDDYKEWTCGNNGQWETDGLGNCEAVSCETPNVPYNGNVTPRKEMYKFQDKVTYECEENYDLIGQRRLTCGEYGYWSCCTPECQAVKCPDPLYPEHGIRIGSSFFVGDTVAFECSSGFKLKGADNRTCLPNAQWSGFLTVCDREDTNCPVLGTPVGGIKNGQSYNVRDVVTFSCGEDFIVEGSETRVCLKNGMWSGTETFCRHKNSYADVQEAAEIFNRKLDTISVETSDSFLGSQLRGNLSLPLGNIHKGRAIQLGYQYGVNVFILVDVSGSIEEKDLDITKEFLKAIVEKLGVSRKIDGTRVTVISFAGDYDEVVTIHDEQSPDAVMAKIDGLTRIEGSTCTATNLAVGKVQDYMDTAITDKIKARALNVLIIITDGMHNIYGSPVPTINELKKEYKIDVYTIGVGGQVDEAILKAMASPDQYQRLKTIGDLESLTNMLLHGSVGYEECGVGGLRNLPPYENLEDFVEAKDIKNWPWMAGLYYDTYRDQSYSTFKCGASLIRPDWLLTAAHCFLDEDDKKDPALWNAKMGALERSVEHGVLLSISEIIIHPGFTRSPNERNDIALVRLTEPLVLSPTIRTVCLPNDLDQFKFSATEQWYQDEKWSVVTGWSSVVALRAGEVGSPRDNLKFTVMRIQSDEECRETLYGGKFVYDDGMYCAGNGENRDSCKGDSGGPSMVEVTTAYKSKRVFQIGVVSWRDGCRQAGKYGFYTRIEKYLPWISDIVGL